MNKLDLYEAEHELIRGVINGLGFAKEDPHDVRNTTEIAYEFTGAVQAIYTMTEGLLEKLRKESEEE